MNVSHYTPKSAFDNQKPPSQVDVSYAQSSTAANGYTKSSETNVYAETFNQELQNENEIIKKLLKILKNNYEIPSALLDDQKKLILKTSMLKEFIASFCSLPVSSILVESYNNSDSGCCGISKNIIEEIEDIKIRVVNGDVVKYRSLKVCYNEIYNRVTEEFNISLKKVINIGN